MLQKFDNSDEVWQTCEVFRYGTIRIQQRTDPGANPSFKYRVVNIYGEPSFPMTYEQARARVTQNNCKGE